MYLSLDMGTTVAKAVLFDKNGHEKFVVEHAYSPLLNAEKTAEQNPEEIKLSLRVILQEVFRCDDAEYIEVVALSTQGGSFIPIAEDGESTHNLITWMDSRAKSIVDGWKEDGTSEQIRRLSGWWVEEGLPLATIEWFRRQYPKDYERTAYFLSLNDYIGMLLTGHLVTNPSCAGEMLLVNAKSGQWDEILCDIIGIKPDMLSVIKTAESQIGFITDEWKKILNFKRAIPVINGGQDHTLEALAVGLTSQGKALLACGTAWVINAIGVFDAMEQIPPLMGVNFHVLDNLRVMSQYLGCFGAELEWWIAEIWDSESSSLTRSDRYTLVNERMQQNHLQQEGLFYLPVSGGRQMKESREGGVFIGLNLNHTKEHMTYAVMEGVAFEVRWALEKLKEHDFLIEELWMIGGATRSSIWVQMIADICCIPIRISHYSHGPALGAAMVAAVSQGDFPDYEACRKVFSIAEKLIKPNPQLRENKKYERFKALSLLMRKED